MFIIIIIIIITIFITALAIPSMHIEGLSGNINPTKKVDGETSHRKHVNFADSVDIMRYDTVSGGSLGMSRGKLAAEKILIGSLEKNVLGDILKIAGDVGEAAEVLVV